jgi:hypothetical protein
VIAEFDAEDTDNATLQAMAAEILRAHPRPLPLPMDIAVPVGGTAFGQTRKSPGHSTGSRRQLVE